MSKSKLWGVEPHWHQEEIIHCPDSKCKGMLLQSIYYHEHFCPTCKSYWVNIPAWEKTELNLKRW